jgi:hypothetical protein
MPQIRIQFSGGPKNGKTEPLRCSAPPTIEAFDTLGQLDQAGIYKYRGNDSTLATANYCWTKTQKIYDVI